MDTHAIIAIVIAAVTFAAILSEKVHKTIAALLGGTAMVIFHVLTEEQAYEDIDLGVIFLLTGMMVIVKFLADSGFFGYVALRLAHIAKGRPIPLLLLLCTVTAGLSALVDNVTTVLLIVPVTFLITEQLEISPIPYLLFEALASNVGGTATLIGDPPNILVGSAAGLSFNDFLFNLTPITAVCIVALLGIALFVMRKQTYVPSDVRARVLEMDPRRAIQDAGLLAKSGGVLLAVLGLFLVHDAVHIPPATIALAGAGVLLLIVKADPEEAFKSVEWPTLFFFIGLFMTVAGLGEAGVLAMATEKALSWTGGDLAITALVIMWFAAAASAIMGNIPVTTALIPVVHAILASPEMADQASAAPALWWSLALGACLGGNGTMFGAAANIIVTEMARNNQHKIGYFQFMAYSLPVTLVTLLLSSLYVCIRYVW